MTQPLNTEISRFIKKHVLGKPQNGLIVTGFGLSKVVEREAQSVISHSLLRDVSSSCEFLAEGNRLWLRGVDYRHLIELCLRLKTAEDIYWEFGHTRVKSRDELHDALSKIEWSEYFPEKASFELVVDSLSSKLFHEKGLKEEIAAFLEKKLKYRSVSQDPQFKLFVVLKRDVLHVLVSFAGEPLYKRGYRARLSGAAPLREDLAAACCAEAMSDANIENIAVPFCGTSTLAFESILKLCDMPNSAFGRSYGFEALRCTPQATSNHLKKQLAALIDKSMKKSLHVRCFDIDKAAVDESMENAAAFRKKLSKDNFDITVVLKDFFEEDVQREICAGKGNVFMPLNPPYGLRLKSNDVLYSRIGRTLEKAGVRIVKEGRALSGFILCASEADWKSFLAEVKSFSTRTTHFTQGGRDIRLCTFKTRKSKT